MLVLEIVIMCGGAESLCRGEAQALMIDRIHLGEHDLTGQRVAEGELETVPADETARTWAGQPPPSYR